FHVSSRFRVALWRCNFRLASLGEKKGRWRGSGWSVKVRLDYCWRSTTLVVSPVLLVQEGMSAPTFPRGRFVLLGIVPPRRGVATVSRDGDSERALQSCLEAATVSIWSGLTS